jgi:hypothetical protein
MNLDAMVALIGHELMVRKGFLADAVRILRRICGKAAENGGF